MITPHMASLPAANQPLPCLTCTRSLCSASEGSDSRHWAKDVSSPASSTESESLDHSEDSRRPPLPPPLAPPPPPPRTVTEDKDEPQDEEDEEVSKASCSTSPGNKVKGA
jgi:hypothetical protein